MIDLWIPLTIAAAFFQNLRSAIQKHLKGRLTDLGAAYVRFLYACPLAILYCAGVATVGGFELPRATPVFLAWCAAGAVGQILFTFLLMWLFSFRNFAVGTTYSKTETVQVAILGFLVLGDRLSAGAIAAIFVSVVGVMALSVARTELTAKRLVTSLGEKPALIGLASGVFLGASSICFRGAALELGDGPAVMRAAFTLAVALVIQALGMGIWMVLRQPGQLKACLRAWRPAGLAGVAAVLASIFWFTAFTLENAAHVRTLGQIELVFTFIASMAVFKERTNRTEIFGILAVVGGILLLLWSA